MQNFISFQRRGWSWRIPNLPLLGFFLCLSFFGLLVTRTGRTGDLILTIYMSYDVSPPKDVPFGSFVDMPPHLGGQISPKRQFWGRKQAFSSLTRKILKLAYYQNYCIHPNQILHSDKDHQMPFVGGPVTRTTNPRWWMAAILAPSWKNQKICMSAMVWPISAKFSTMTQFDPIYFPTPKISTVWKSKMAVAAILNNRHISATVWPFGTVTHTGTLTHYVPYRQSKIRPPILTIGKYRCQ